MMLMPGLGVLFWALSTRLGALLLTGRAVPIASQSFAARHALLKRWSVSRIDKFREAFQVSAGVGRDATRDVIGISDPTN